MEVASVRELKSRLSHYLRLTRAGGAVEITDRGVPIGRIVPVAPPAADRVSTMTDAGLLAWNQRRLAPLAPVARTRGGRSVAELLIEDRG